MSESLFQLVIAGGPAIGGAVIYGARLADPRGRTWIQLEVVAFGRPSEIVAVPAQGVRLLARSLERAADLLALPRLEVAAEPCDYTTVGPRGTITVCRRAKGECQEHPQEDDVGTISKLSAKGDEKITWRPGDAESVANARTAFNALKRAGYTAFEIGQDDKRGARVDEFREDLGVVVFVPRTKGG